jgi:hypothetical protein
MGSCQPFLEDIRVEAAWTGDLSAPVKLKISIDVVTNGRSHLSLIRNDHPAVLHAEIAAISRLGQNGEKQEVIASPSISPSSSHLPLLEETFDSPAADPNVPLQEISQHGSPPLHDEELSPIFVDRHTVPHADTTHPKNKPVFVSFDQHKSSAETAEISLFSQTASLYEATSSHGSALSPPPPSTSKKLTITKRLSLEPASLHSSKQHSPVRKRQSKRDDNSPHSMRKRPVSLDKRPPWRPVGIDDTTPRGRRQLGTESAKRKVSRSAGTIHVNRGRKRHRRSSLPGQVPKTKVDSHSSPVGERQNWPKTLPRTRPTWSPLPEPRQRDSTVKVTGYGEALNASERLEKWIEDRQNHWPTESSSPNDFILDDDISHRITDVAESSDAALSPSPTPSSRAALPWTSLRGIRGGGSNDESYYDKAEEAPLTTLIEDNGIIFAFFRGRRILDAKNARVRIEIHARITLEAQHSGSFSLTIPGLPMQGGHAEGSFTLHVKGPSSSESDGFRAYEKVAYIEDDFSTHPLQHSELSHTFRLDNPFKISFLCFEACRVLEPSNFEIDSDIHSRYDWENLDGGGITAEHSMICSIRLHPFLLWAEYVQFKLYLLGGPSGRLEASLEPGHRRIYLEGKRCDTEHELEISMTCTVADLLKTFTISWDQSLGVAPFEIWLPRISGLYRSKLEDIFDLPDEAGISITPRPCRRSRRYSMDAQDSFLKSSGEIYFFPENQHTSRSIQQSLREESGQFYDELTGEYSDFEPETLDRKDCKLPPKKSLINMEATMRQRARLSGLRDIVTDSGHPSGTPSRLVRISEGRADLKNIAGRDRSEKEAAIGKGERQRPKSILIRGSIFIIDMISWIFVRLVAPMRVLKTIILIWLCLRAFQHDSVARVETYVISTAKDTWDRWDFQPVQLHDDFTGWKHLMAKAKLGKERVNDDADGLLGSADVQPEELGEEPTGGMATAIVTEDVVPEAVLILSEDMPTVSLDEQTNRPSPSPSPSSSPHAQTAEPSERLTFLDRIDRVLGWKPPRGT